MFNWFRKHKDNGKPEGILAAVGLPKHEHDLATIKLQDVIYDQAMDNTDLEDIATINIVHYCKTCGQITKIERSNVFRDRESPMYEIRQFEEITGINHRTVTLCTEVFRLINYILP